MISMQIPSSDMLETLLRGIPLHERETAEKILTTIMDKTPQRDWYWKLPVARYCIGLVPNWPKYVNVDNINAMYGTYLRLRQDKAHLNFDDPQTGLLTAMANAFIDKFCPELKWIVDLSRDNRIKQ